MLARVERVVRIARVDDLGSAISRAALGLASGTSMIWMTPWCGWRPTRGPFTGPQVGPGASGYDETQRWIVLALIGFSVIV